MIASEILQDLIRLRTDGGTLGNRALVEYVCGFLAHHGVIFERIVNPSGGAENIVAGINVKELCNISEGIVLSGHTDTVGADEALWEFPPFAGKLANGRIYGRGAVDMKYFLAAVLSLLPEIKKVNIPVILAFTADEETSVCGVREVLSFFQKRNIKPKFALIGEPTHFELCVANRGYAGYKSVIKGVSAHSGSPELGVNAAYIAAKMISKIEELNLKYADLGVSLNVGAVHGGTERNTVPDNTVIDWDIRYWQEEVKTQILNELEAFSQTLLVGYPRAEILLQTAELLPAFEEKKDSLLTQLTGEILKTQTISLPYATEAGFFQQAGFDTLICGAGNEAKAHTSSEHIEVEDLRKYCAFLQELLKNL